MSILFLFFSPDFVTIFVLITIFGNMHRQCKHYSNIVHNSLHHVYSFFLFFFLIFWLYLHFLPYLEMCTDHVNSTPILSTTVYIMSVLFFSFFPDFMAIFTSITILGNAHRPCKQLSNITPSLYFSWFFSYCFSSELQNLPYLAIFSVHSIHWIPVPFRSGQFRGLFRWNYQNIKIPWQEWNFGW